MVAAGAVVVAAGLVVAAGAVVVAAGLVVAAGAVVVVTEDFPQAASNNPVVIMIPAKIYNVLFTYKLLQSAYSIYNLYFQAPDRIKQFVLIFFFIKSLNCFPPLSYLGIFIGKRYEIY